MKRSLILTIVLLLLSALTVTSVLAARDPFIGTWESQDLDGSYQTLTIGGGDGFYNVRYYDSGATVCGLDPETDVPLYAAFARGLLKGSDGTITGILPAYCMTGPPTYWGDANFTYSYNEDNDTLIGADGVVWHRR